MQWVGVPILMTAQYVHKYFEREPYTVSAGASATMIK